MVEVFGLSKVGGQQREDGLLLAELELGVGVAEKGGAGSFGWGLNGLSWPGH